jgi:XTP/dITP diphosphohydrolase
MNRIVFATNNKHKLQEVSEILKGKFEVLSLLEIGCTEDIPETAETLEGNALLKARYVKEKYGFDCFADDTGLEIEALNFAPGVISARYAGDQRSSADNIAKVMQELDGKASRKAQFRTIVAYLKGDQEYTFEGKVLGEITAQQSGTGGFGYDSIFRPEGFNETFAELGSAQKNAISHRALAIKKLIQFMQENA